MSVQSPTNAHALFMKLLDVMKEIVTDQSPRHLNERESEELADLAVGVNTLLEHYMDRLVADRCAELPDAEQIIAESGIEEGVEAMNEATKRARTRGMANFILARQGKRPN